MKILAVDNEKIALEGLCREIRASLPGDELYMERNAAKALELAKKVVPDVVFLEIRMPGTDGLSLAKRIKGEINPKVNIIVTTGDNEYVEEAFMRLRVSGYLIKPVTSQMIKDEIKNLRFPVAHSGQHRLRVRAFGTFEAFIDDRPVIFHYRKTKELLAYLIDFGGMCPTAQILDSLWEDESEADHRSYLQNMISDLRSVLKSIGCDDVVIKRYGLIGIDRTRIDCDYYEFTLGNQAAAAFRGEYMSQYSWAEKTLGSLYFADKKSE